MPLTTAEAMDYGATLSGRLDTQRAARAFTLEAAAGDRIYVDMQALTQPGHNAAWRLFDPFGQQVLLTEANDLDGITLPIAGKWMLVLEGDRFTQQQAPLDYRFALFKVNTDPQAITLGGANPGLGPVTVESPLDGGLVLRGAEMIEVARNIGYRVFYGDATRLDLLRNAGQLSGLELLDRLEGLAGDAAAGKRLLVRLRHSAKVKVASGGDTPLYSWIGD